MKTYHIYIYLLLLIACKENSTRLSIEENVKEVYTDDDVKKGVLTPDSLAITLDFYLINDSLAPFILLFHQAQFSRGEYLEIAPKLNELGYNAVAIDQRSGSTVNGIMNYTNMQAIKKGFPTEYVDAYIDLETTLEHVKTKYPKNKILVWGSSYSASLVYILAAKNPEIIDGGVLSFSPGEYFTFKGKTVAEYAALLPKDLPVFITSAKNEEENWKNIYKAIPTENKRYFLPKGKGFHGSKALWEKNEGYQEYWGAVQGFLEDNR